MKPEPRARTHDPKRISDLVGSVLQQASHHYAALDSVRQRWGRLVGKELAAHTRPISLRAGQLVVAADQPGDGFALQYRQPDLLVRIRSLTHGRVERMIIRPGEPDGVRH